MLLQEELSRMKTIMGLQPLNEGLFRKSGKLKNILRGLFKNNNPSEEIIKFVDPYDTKYGNDNANLEGFTTLITNDEQVDGSNKMQEVYCSFLISTGEPQPLPSDPTKKSTNKSYLVNFEKRGGDNKEETYVYFKSLFFIDGEQTDEVSNVMENGNYTCTTDTLAGKDGSCELSQEVKDKLLEYTRTSKDFSQIQSYLEKIQ
jgi:hypothetical protein